MWVKFVTQSRGRGHGWEGGGLSLCQTVQSFTDAPRSHLLHSRVSRGGRLSPLTPPPPRGVGSTSALNAHVRVRARPTPPKVTESLRATLLPSPGDFQGLSSPQDGAGTGWDRGHLRGLFLAMTAG